MNSQDKENNMIPKMAEIVADNLNNNYVTIGEIAKQLGYTDHSYLSRKASKLGLGFKIKTFRLLSKEEEEILKKSIKRRGSKFSSE